MNSEWRKAELMRGLMSANAEGLSYTDAQLYALSSLEHTLQAVTETSNALRRIGYHNEEIAELLDVPQEEVSASALPTISPQKWLQDLQYCRKYWADRYIRNLNGVLPADQVARVFEVDIHAVITLWQEKI